MKRILFFLCGLLPLVVMAGGISNQPRTVSVAKFGARPDDGKSDTEAMNDFLKKFSARKAGKHVVMLLDRAGWHTTGKLETPENISLVFLPPVSPQLNPIERLWKKIKTDFFHNRIHDGIEDVKASVAKALATLTATAVASICACSYLDACL